jgi:hypothetical protein
MEDLIPLLIFAVISAITHLINRKKEGEEAVSWEEVEQQAAENSRGDEVVRSESPSRDVKETKQPRPSTVFEEWQRMLEEARQQKDGPPPLPGSNSGDEGDSAPRQFQGPVTPAGVEVDRMREIRESSASRTTQQAMDKTRRALEEARDNKNRAKRKLERATQRAEDMMEATRESASKPEGAVLHSPSDTYTSSAGRRQLPLFQGRSQNIRDAFVASLIFDKPSGLKDSFDER